MIEDEVIEMLEQHSPLALTFARAKAKQTSTAKTWISSSPLSFDIESADTFSISATDHNHLGCIFAIGHNGTDILVKSITGVEGPFQQQMKAAKYPFIGCVLESVDGEVVPSYVNCQIIISSINRQWTANGRVELTFCNEKHKDAVRKVG